MRYEELLQPIDDDAPCGPDLDEDGDDDYLNYFLPAEDKLPERYIEMGTGKTFDKTEINIKNEVKSISALLERSRDIRLLCLEARFQCLAGKIVGYCECIIALSRLLDTFWEDIHPQGYEGDFSLRQNTISALESRATIILPLQFATLVTDKRHGGISYRHYAIGAGISDPVEDETVPDSNAVSTALSSEDNLEEVTNTLELIRQTKTAYDGIRSLFIDKMGYDDAPSFKDTLAILSDIQSLLETSRPELSENPDHAADGEGNTEIGEDGEVTEDSAQVAVSSTIVSGSVQSHTDAANALFSVETYFSSHEPSSPALILVHQSRMLVGQPMVRAMEALMPESAERALIKFEPDLSFQLDMSRMRLLSDEATEAGQGVFENPGSGEEFSVASRSDASALIQMVETFFKATEPSSPIPMLLAKARGYLSRDFNSILKEFIVKIEEETY